MSDPFTPRRRPNWGAATSEILFPRPWGYPEDFSPYWPHGLDFSARGDPAAGDPPRSSPEWSSSLSPADPRSKAGAGPAPLNAPGMDRSQGVPPPASASPRARQTATSATADPERSSGWNNGPWTPPTDGELIKTQSVFGDVHLRHRDLAATARPPSAPAGIYDPQSTERFILRHVGDGSTSHYGVQGFHQDVRGQVRGAIGGLFSNKCNFFVHDAIGAGGIDARLPNGNIPSAHDWYDPAVNIVAFKNGKAVGTFDVVARGDLSAPSFNLDQLTPTDIVASPHHVGLYYPKRSAAVAGDKPRLGGMTISAATRDHDHSRGWLDQTGIFGGVRWAPWGFRPGEEPDMSVRRFKPSTAKRSD